MEKRYFRLRDTSGTFWSGALNTSFRRDVPVVLEGGPEIKVLLAKKIIVEITETEYKSLCEKHNIEITGNTAPGEKIEPTPVETSDSNSITFDKQEQGTEVTQVTQEPASEEADQDKNDDLDALEDQEEKNPEEVNAPPGDLLPVTKEFATKLLKLATDKKVVTQNRGWYKFGDVTLGKSLDQATNKVKGSPKIVADLKTVLGITAD